MNQTITRGQALDLADALQIFTKNARLREWLETVDPKALAQAERALAAVGINPHAEGFSTLSSEDDAMWTCPTCGDVMLAWQRNDHVVRGCTPKAKGGSNGDR